MIFIIIFKPFRQLSHPCKGKGIWPVFNEDVISFERLHKGFSHAVALGAVSRRAARNEIDAPGKLYGFAGKIIFGVIRQPFNFIPGVGSNF